MNKVLSLAVIASFAVAANVSAADKAPAKTERELRFEARAKARGQNPELIMLGQSGKANDIVKQGAKREAIKEAGFFDKAKAKLNNGVELAKEHPYITAGATIGTVAAVVVIADLCRKNSKIRGFFSKKPATVVVAAQN